MDMKKVMALGLVLLTMLTMFTGCKGEDTIHSLGIEALGIADSFLDGNINSSKAIEKFDAIGERFDIERPEKDSPEWAEYLSITSKAGAIHLTLQLGETPSETVLGYRNSLAEVLGKPLRDK